MLSTAANVSVQPFFHAGTAEDLCDFIETRLNAQVVRVAGHHVGDTSQGTRCALPRSELWFCSYGLPITLRIPDSDYVRVQFRVAGDGETRVGPHNVAVTSSQACVSAGAAEIRVGADLKQVVWRIGVPQIVSAMSALVGAPITTTPRFDPLLDLYRPSSQAMLGVLKLVLQSLQAGGTVASPLLLAELEQALIVAFLCGSSHNLRDLIDRRTAGPAPWQVRRAETYIEAHWDQPITIQALAEATGASARSIFRAFQHHRGCSPLEFAKRVRLQKARHLLEHPDASDNVTSVALTCGYSDLAHFSRDFVAAFGQRPSELLARRRSYRRAG